MRIYNARTHWLFCLLVLSFGSSAICMAQGGTGLPKFGTFAKDVDTINIENLNVHLDIPLVQKPSRGFSPSLELIYDSPTFVYFPEYYGNGVGSATVNSATVIVRKPSQGTLQYNTDVEPCLDQPDDSNTYAIYYSGYIFTDQDNTSHPFNLQTSNTLECAANTVTSASGYASDGSGYFLSVDAENFYTITSTSGISYSNDDWHLPLDTNGNTDPCPISCFSASITYSANPNSQNQFSPGTTSVETITYIDANGAQQNVLINMTYMSLITSISSTVNSGDLSNYAWLPTSILYPDGSSYIFTYEPAIYFPGYTTGRLQTLKLPTGGTISYQYVGGTNGYTVDDLNYAGTAGIIRTSADGSTTYGRAVAMMPSSVGGTYETVETSVQDGQGNTTLFDFVGDTLGNNIRETRRRIYQGGTNGALLKDIMRCYNGSSGDCTTLEMPASPNMIVDATTTLGNQMSRQKTIYNLYGLVSEIDDYDFGAGAPTKKTVTNYATLGNNILDRPSSVIVYDSSGNIAASTSYGYDENTLAPTSGLSNHSPVAGARGNLTSIHKLLSGSGATVMQSYTYDDAGVVQSTADANGNTTSYTHDATDTFVTSVQHPTTNGIQHVEHYTFDSNTGLLASKTDQNGVQTEITYDGMNRSTRIQAAVGTAQETWTTYSYPNSDEIDFAQDEVTKGDGVIKSSIIYDGFGRVIHQIDPAGSTVDTTYNSVGEVASVSNPHGGSSSATDGTTTYSYDALGRKTVQTQPDGNTQQWSYFGNVATFTDEANHSWQRTSDAWGRLTKVVEPGSLATTYQYSVLGDLTCGDQWETGTIGQPCTSSRVRSFVYDSLSRLTSATNPETGTLSYTYDANGNVQTKTAPAQNSAPGSGQTVTTTYSYDALNRLTFKTYSDGNWPAGFGYDGKSETGATLPVTPTNSIGRMSISSNTVDAATIYSYDPVGRVVQQNTCLPDDCSYGMTERATYDLAGNVTSLTYPDGRVVTHGIDGNGHLQNVTFDNWSGQHVGYTYASAFTYTAAGAQAEVTYGNGIYIHTPYNNRQQMCQVWSQIPSQPLIDTHIYYGGSTIYCNSTPGNNGNITQIKDWRNPNHTRYFGYDALNRINAFSNGDGSMQQNYSYDSFGNLSQSGTLNSQVGFDSNNRVNTGGYAYDAAGNLSSFNNGAFTATYGYNAENALINFNNGVAGYITSGDGKRIQKHVGDSWTEYVYFGEQLLAEKNSDGTWSDYIYANGQKIARADSYAVRIHFTGTNCSNCGPTAWAYDIPVPAYTIQSGDKMAWRQYQDGPAIPRGGVGIQFTDGTYTNWVAVDQDGQMMNNDATQNAWHYRVVDLSQFVGKTIAASWINEDAGSGAGDWEEWFSDISFYRLDGTVQPIYDRQRNVSYPSFGQGVTNQTFEINVSTQPGDAEQYLNSTTYYVGDHLGSTVLTASGGGWPMSSDTFYPFGQEQSPSGDPNHYKFTGKERDSESSLDNFGARMYSSAMGRWLSPDPAGIAAVNPSYPQTWNLYAYAANNPLVYVDPNGLDCVYFNDAGTDLDDKLGDKGPVNPIDHNSSSGECKQTGGAWVDGYTDSSMIARTANGNFNIGSYDGNNVYFTQVMAPDPSASGWSRFWGTACSGGTDCQVATSAPISRNELAEQLNPTGGTIPGLLAWAVKQTNGVSFLQNQSFGMSSEWCGRGGSGVPGASSGWACMAHDYNYYLSGNTWPGHNADADQSWKGGPQLQRINQQLCEHTSNILVQEFFSQGYNGTLGVGSTWGCR